jgi:hypothetical protein
LLVLGEPGSIGCKTKGIRHFAGNGFSAGLRFTVAGYHYGSNGNSGK